MYVCVHGFVRCGEVSRFNSIQFNSIQCDAINMETSIYTVYTVYIEENVNNARRPIDSDLTGSGALTLANWMTTRGYLNRSVNCQWIYFQYFYDHISWLSDIIMKVYSGVSLISISHHNNIKLKLELWNGMKIYIGISNVAFLIILFLLCVCGREGKVAVRRWWKLHILKLKKIKWFQSTGRYPHQKLISPNHLSWAMA